MKWRKSTHSNGEDTHCVEVANTDQQMFAARDSKSPRGPILHLSRSNFARLLLEVKAGRFDL
jgi:hypothetical protein